MLEGKCDGRHKWCVNRTRHVCAAVVVARNPGRFRALATLCGVLPLRNVAIGRGGKLVSWQVSSLRPEDHDAEQGRPRDADGVQLALTTVNPVAGPALALRNVSVNGAA